jgi:LysM repeat protein
LQSICSKFRVDGKYVIRANKLKKPYFVNAGEKIFIPKKEK